MNFGDRRVQTVWITFLLLILTGCAAVPPERETALPNQTVDHPASEPGLKRLIIFNDSNALLHGIDNAGRMNVYLNGKGVGQLPIGRYVVIELESGTHELQLEHRDLKLFKSTHSIRVLEDNQFLRIYSTMTSNGAETVERPEDFEDVYVPAF